MNAAAAGDKAAADRLLPMVYEHLRKAAQSDLMDERTGHTLSATALVHEAYLKLVGPREVAWASRGHFYSAAAEAMRRILLDYARSRARRGGGATRLAQLDNVAALATAAPDQIEAVDAALRRLETDDPEAASMIRMRFFAGLTVDQAAQVLGMSPRTAARVWSYARVALYRDLDQDT